MDTTDLSRFLQATFTDELAERLAALEEHLLALEVDPAGPEALGHVEELFRAAHSLKGAAQIVGRDDVREVANELEDRLGDLRRGRTAEPGELELLFDVLSRLRALEALVDGPPAGSEAAGEHGAGMGEGRAGDGEVSESRVAERQASERAAPAGAAPEGAASEARAGPRPDGGGAGCAGSGPARRTASSVGGSPGRAAGVGPAVPRSGRAARGGGAAARNGGRGAASSSRRHSSSAEPGLWDAASPATIEGVSAGATVPMGGASAVPQGSSWVRSVGGTGGAVGQPGPRIVRVSTARVDAALGHSGALLQLREEARARYDEIRRALDLAEAARRWLATTDRAILDRPGGKPAARAVGRAAGRDARFRPPGGATGRPDGAAEGLATPLEELVARLRRLSAAVRAERARAAALAEAVGRDLLGLRLVPVGSVFEQYPRMVRDLAKAADKDVEFQAVGWTTEMDRELLERLRDPVMHLLRNAVDHGIESPAGRTSAGKSPRGRIVLAARQEGGGVVVEVRDDGRGIDAGAVLRAATGVVPADRLPSSPSLDATLDLVFAAGVTTSPSVGDVSGRGVGLDVVRRTVAAIGGRVRLESAPGVGTTVRLEMPLTLLLARILLVAGGGRTCALPLQGVERCLRFRPGDANVVAGRSVLALADGTIPLVDLTVLLGGAGSAGTPAEPPEGRSGGAAVPRTVVVLEAGERRVGLLVDRVLAVREVVVRNLGPLIGGVAQLVAGAAVLEGEQLALLLDPAAVGRAALEASTPYVLTAATEQPAPMILVVDDSLTTRTLERSILEAAGFRVAVAEDGLAAWERIRSGGIDLVVADVDMPRLDGLDLTRRIKAEPNLRELPVVLVTALDAPEQRDAGLDAGADAYLVKSAFDQRALIGTIRRLLG